MSWDVNPGNQAPNRQGRALVRGEPLRWGMGRSRRPGEDKGTMLQEHEPPGQRPRWPRLGQGKVAGVEERKEEEQCLRVTLGLSLHPCPCEPLFTSTKIGASEVKGMGMLCQL